MDESRPTPEVMIAFLVAIVIGGLLVWRALRWFFSGPTTPEPWGSEIDEKIHQPDAVPLCTRCLEAYSPEICFCPHCGAPVDPLVNFNPYLYVFSLGDVLRLGSFGNFRFSRLALWGFAILSLAEYAIFAPIYWFFLIRNVERQHQRTEDAPPIITSPG